MTVTKNGYWLSAIIILALGLRLFPHVDFSGGNIGFAGTCGQLFDEVKPLVESRNLLNFEVFFYPPVAPLIVAGTARIVSVIIPGVFDLALHCLFITIVFSTATIAVIYYIGREWSSTVGLVAAALYGVAMIAVDSATNVQVYSAFFVLLTILFFFKCWHQPTPTNLLLMGAFLGFAIGSKYFPVVLVPMFFLLHFVVRNSGERLYEPTPLKGLGNARVNFQSSLLNAALSILLCACLGLLYIGMVHQDVLLSLLKEVYNAHSHEHPFEYHLNPIKQILNAGLFGAGAIGIYAAS